MEDRTSRVVPGIRQTDLSIVDRGQQTTIIVTDHICDLNDHQ